MYIEHLDIVNFRNYSAAQLEPATDGLTLLRGDNGSGKTNLLEAIGYMATLRSFRGVPAAALIRTGEPQAVLRSSARRDGRPVQVETELNVIGKDRARLNRQPLRRKEDLAGVFLATIFSSDDIEIVKGGPQSRRDYLDEVLVCISRKYAVARAALERLLRQRNALLRSANGALRPGMGPTLDVWDTKLADVGEKIAEERITLVASLQPAVATAYAQLGGTAKANQLGAPTLGGPDVSVAIDYERSWSGPLLEALATSRNEDVRRGTTGVGPQRDELDMTIGGLAARSQASQGEQRALALALRLGAHSLVAAHHETSPVLLLDDVFSELDPGRCASLASCLPSGQALLTTAGPVPTELAVAASVLVQDGTLTVESSRGA